MFDDNVEYAHLDKLLTTSAYTNIELTQEIASNLLSRDKASMTVTNFLIRAKRAGTIITSEIGIHSTGKVKLSSFNKKSIDKRKKQLQLELLEKDGIHYYLGPTIYAFAHTLLTHNMIGKRRDAVMTKFRKQHEAGEIPRFSGDPTGLNKPVKASQYYQALSRNAMKSLLKHELIETKDGSPYSEITKVNFTRKKVPESRHPAP